VFREDIIRRHPQRSRLGHFTDLQLMSDTDSEEEKMDNAFRRAKFAKFIEIESNESFEKWAVGRNYSFN
jgi:hypothetical protein